MSTPSQDAIALIYDLERAGEKSFSAYFTANGIKGFSSQAQPTTGNADSDAALIADGWTIIDFQKDRPRVETFATVGAGKGQFIPHPQYPRVECETQWDYDLSFLLVTVPDMRIHTAYRTTLRYLIHRARGVINGTGDLTNHYLGQFADGGTSPVMKTEDGDFQTTINLSTLISVQANAWAGLTQ